MRRLLGLIGLRATRALGPAYERLLAASAVSTIGDGIRFAALPLLAATTLGTPFQIAAVAAVGTLPWLVAGLPAGAFVDRRDRVRVMVAADALRATLLVLLVVLVAADSVTLWPLLALSFGLGVGEVLFDLAAFAVVPSIVAPADLETANGRLYSTQTLGRDLAGQLVGAALFGLLRLLPFALDAFSFVASALLLRRIPGRRSERETPAETEGSLFAGIGEGCAFLFRNPTLRTLAFAAGAVNAVFLGEIAIVVLFVLHVLGLPQAVYGVVLAAIALGSVAGGLAASRVRNALGREATILASLLTMALASALVAATTSPVVALGAFALMGFGMMVWNVIAVSLRQTLVPDRLLGRTTSVYRLVSWGTMPLGGFAFGLVADRFGLRVPFAVGGALIAAVAVAAAPVLLGPARRERVASTNV